MKPTLRGRASGARIVEGQRADRDGKIEALVDLVVGDHLAADLVGRP
jgi:hypothetical protein